MISVIEQGINTKAKTVVVARNIERIRAKHERTINYNTKLMFRNLYHDLLSLDEIPTESELASVIQNQNAFTRRMFETVYLDTVDDVAPMVSDGSLTKAAFDTAEDRDDLVYRLRTLDWVNRCIAVHIDYIDATTQKALQEILMASSTTAEFHRLIYPYFSTIAPNRAYIIARTESASATNISIHESMKATDTGRSKVTVWNAIIDERTRDSHIFMNQKTIPFGDGQAFDVPNRYGLNDRLPVPADSSMGATAGNIINCRCFPTYRYA